MPESPLETHELREQLEEAHKHAGGEHEEGGHGPAWLRALSVTTALLAAVAAVAALNAGALANDAIVAKNDAVLKQSRASDNWALFQAKRIKSYILSTQAELMPEGRREAIRAQAEREGQEAAAPAAEARKLEVERDEANAESAHALERHEWYARSVTLFQIAIALSAIAALTRRRAVWFVSLVAGGLGLIIFAIGFRAGHGPGSAHSAAAKEEAPKAAGE